MLSTTRDVFIGADEEIEGERSPPNEAGAAVRKAMCEVRLAGDQGAVF